MAALQSNSFTSYELTEQEALQGSSYTGLQLQVLQNILANIAEEKIRLIYDPKNPEQFVQQEASLKGALDIITHLIDTSNVAEQELLNPTCTD